MPIYEYRCSSCGHELEAMQKFSDAPLVACPSCNADALVKLVSAAGFQLKGSGWYATDFRNAGSKPAPAKGDGTKGDGAKAEGGKAEGGKAEGGKADASKPAEGGTGAKVAAKSDSTAPASGCGSGCA